MANAYLRIKEHPHEAPEFKPYEHMRKRDKVKTPTNPVVFATLSCAFIKF